MSLAIKRSKVNEFEIIEAEWKNSHEREWHHKTKFKDKKSNKWRPNAKKIVTFGGSYIEFDHHIRVWESAQVSLTLHFHPNP